MLSVWLVQAFRLLDPKGVLLEALSGPLIEVRSCAGLIEWFLALHEHFLWLFLLLFFVFVGQYLRQRKDTVRCIVQSLTDDEHGDLFNELRRDNMQIIQHVDDSDDDEVRLWWSWTPSGQDC